MEGLHGLIVIAKRKSEKTVPMGEMLRRLKKHGRL